MTIINKLKDSYNTWFHSFTHYEELHSDNSISINTPYIDINCDPISLYARRKKNGISISDAGFTIYNLKEYGINISHKSKTQLKIFNNILNLFNINYNRTLKNLYVYTSIKNFPDAKLNLLQAILHIQDIFYLSRNTVINSFNDIIKDSLNERHVKFTKPNRIKTQNDSYTKFDLLIPSKHHNNKLIRTFPNPNELSKAKIFNFDARSTHDVKPNFDIVAILNDTRSTNIRATIPKTALAGVNNYTSIYTFTSALRNNVLSNN